LRTSSTRIPRELLELLGIGPVEAWVVELDVPGGYAYFDVEEFVEVLDSVAQTFVDRGLEVVGILDPLWAPARFVKKIPLALFKPAEHGLRGIGWKLYRVREHVYLQLFSSASVVGVEEVYSPSNRVLRTLSSMGVDLAELLMGPELLRLEPIPGLDASVTPCIGDACMRMDLESFVSEILERTMEMYSGEDLLVVVVGNPRMYSFVKAPTLWLPSTLPNSLELLDSMVERIGAEFGRCRVYVSKDSAVWGRANFLTSYPRSPIEAILYDVCKSVEVFADSDDECTSVRSMSSTCPLLSSTETTGRS